MLEIAIAPNSRSHGREISLGAHKDNEYSHARLVRDAGDREDYEPEWRKDTKKFER